MFFAMNISQLTVENLSAHKTVPLATLLESPKLSGSSYEVEITFTDETITSRLGTSEGQMILGSFEASVLMGTIGIRRHSVVKKKP